MTELVVEGCNIDGPLIVILDRVWEIERQYIDIFLSYHS